MTNPFADTLIAALAAYVRHEADAATAAGFQRMTKTLLKEFRTMATKAEEIAAELRAGIAEQTTVIAGFGVFIDNLDTRLEAALAAAANAASVEAALEEFRSFGTAIRTNTEKLKAEMVQGTAAEDEAPEGDADPEPSAPVA